MFTYFESYSNTEAGKTFYSWGNRMISKNHTTVMRALGLEIPNILIPVLFALQHTMEKQELLGNVSIQK